MASKLLTALLWAAAHALPQGGIRQALRDAALQRKTHKKAVTLGTAIISEAEFRAMVR